MKKKTAGKGKVVKKKAAKKKSVKKKEATKKPILITKIEKPIILERDLKSRGLVDQFYGGDEDQEMSGGIDQIPVEKTPEEVLAEERKPIEEIQRVEPESGQPSDKVRQALLDTMQQRSLKETKRLTLKDKEKAEQINTVLNAAEGLYKGTRKVTRETLDFAGDFAKGSFQVATTVAGGVLVLAGQGVLGIVRIAGMGYRGVGATASGLGKGVSHLTGKVKGEKKGLSVGSIVSGIRKKTSDFLSIEDAKKDYLNIFLDPTHFWKMLGKYFH